MNMLVIGNGFDIAHGLPTQYSQFLKVIDMFQIICMAKRNFSEMEVLDNLNIQKKLIDIDTFLKKSLVETINDSDYAHEFDELSRLCSNNFWLDMFEKRSNSIGENWIDFEKEITYFLKNSNLDNIMQEKENSIHMKELHSLLDDYIMRNLFVDTKGFKVSNEEIIDILVSDLEDFIYMFELYLKIFVQPINIEKINYIENLNVDKVLSFNYTDTYENLYGIENKAIEIEYDYIHGKVRKYISDNSIANNMVLGIDEYLNDEEKDINLAFIRFKKYFQRIFKKTGCKYKKWIDEEYMKPSFRNPNPYLDEIYFIGHSLDITDKDILKNIFSIEDCIFKIFYHTETANISQIINLVKVIGQDVLTEKVYGSNPSIIFEKIPQKKIFISEMNKEEEYDFSDIEKNLN